MRAVKAVLKIISAVITLALALLLAGNIYVIAARALTGEQMPELFGFSSAVVVTGSMSPAIEAGDFIVCRESAGYRPGDIITFRSGGSMVTHRITGTADGGFITKGDANNTEDIAPVAAENVVGIYKARIPALGDVAMFMQKPVGMAIFIGIPVLAFVLYDSAARRRAQEAEKRRADELQRELERLKHSEE